MGSEGVASNTTLQKGSISAPSNEKFLTADLWRDIRLPHQNSDLPDLLRGNSYITMNTTIESIAAAWSTAPKSVLPTQSDITGARWHCAGGRRTQPYVAPLFQNVHVVSLLLRGFTGEVWLDGKTFYTGRVSANQLRVTPAGHMPSWRADGTVEVFHVYVPDAALRRQLAVLGYCGDASQNALRLTKYMSDPLLQNVMHRLAVIARVDGRLEERYLKTLEDTLLLHLLIHYGGSASVRGDSPVLPSAGVNLAIEAISTDLGTHLPISELAKVAGMSAAQFNRNFQKVTGFTPHQYRLQLRVEAAKAKLAGRDEKLATIADELGFTDQAHFTRTFRQFTGMSPGEFSTHCL